MAGIDDLLQTYRAAHDLGYADGRAPLDAPDYPQMDVSGSEDQRRLLRAVSDKAGFSCSPSDLGRDEVDEIVGWYEAGWDQGHADTS